MIDNGRNKNDVSRDKIYYKMLDSLAVTRHKIKRTMQIVLCILIISQKNVNLSFRLLLFREFNLNGNPTILTLKYFIIYEYK